jgi:hypothetical protein
MIVARLIGISIVVVCIGALYLLRDKPVPLKITKKIVESGCGVTRPHTHDHYGRPVPSDGDMCCDPDYDFENGHYVHERGCQFQ